jgi:putative tricarboxylic transport membrane protein
VILGPLAEQSFITSMISFQNDWTVFFARPISGTVIALAILALLFPFARHILQRRGLAAENARPTRKRRTGATGKA